MSGFVPAEKSTTIRMPSTANLCVDSADRAVDASGNYIEPVWDFRINRNQSILNGFFTRIGMTETYLKWDTPNISTALGNRTLSLDISGSPPYVINMNFPNQFCGTAAAIFDAIIKYVNDLSGLSGFYFTMLPNQGGLNYLAPSTYQLIGNEVTPGTNGGYFQFADTPLARQLNILNLPNPPGLVKYVEPTSPDLRPFAFIDFVSPNLTYNQDLKDATTNQVVVDVLQRFYFALSEENSYDKYNFPILMGYKPFVIERMFNPPKQIRWDNIQPVGQLQIQVYGQPLPLNLNPATRKNYGVITLPSYFTNFGFTLQVSEV